MTKSATIKKNKTFVIKTQFLAGFPQEIITIFRLEST